MTRTVQELCGEAGIGAEELAARAGLEVGRIQAILSGRWTPSPSERDRVAGAFGLQRDDVAWGHRNPVAHIHGHGPQFGRSP